MDCGDNKGSIGFQNLDNACDLIGYENLFSEFYTEDAMNFGIKGFEDKEGSRNSALDIETLFEVQEEVSREIHSNMEEEAAMKVVEDDHDDFPGLSPLRGDCVLSSSNIGNEVEAEYLSRMFEDGRGCSGCDNFLFSSSVDTDGELANPGDGFSYPPPSNMCMIDRETPYGYLMKEKNECLVDSLQNCHNLPHIHAGKMKEIDKDNGFACLVQGSSNEPIFPSVIDSSTFDIQRSDFDSFERTSTACCTDESECCTDAKNVAGVISNSASSTFIRRTNPKRAASLRSNLNDGKYDPIVPSDRRKCRRKFGASIYCEPLSLEMFCEVKRKVRNSCRQARLSVWGAVENLSSLIKQGHEYVKHDTKHYVSTKRRLKKTRHEAIRRRGTTLLKNKHFLISSKKPPSSSQPIPSTGVDTKTSLKICRENFMATSDASEICSMKIEQEQNTVKKWYVVVNSNTREGHHGEKDMESTLTQETSADSPFFECHGVSSRVAEAIDDKQPSNAGNSPDSDVYNPLIDTGISSVKHSAFSKEETVSDFNNKIQEPKEDVGLPFEEVNTSRPHVIRLPLSLKQLRACESPRKNLNKSWEGNKVMKKRRGKEGQVRELKNASLSSNRGSEFLKATKINYKRGTESKRFECSDLDNFNNCMEMENRAETSEIRSQKDNNEQSDAFLPSDYIKECQIRTQKRWSKSKSGHSFSTRQSGKVISGQQKGDAWTFDQDTKHSAFPKENEDLVLTLETTDKLLLLGDHMQGETSSIDAFPKYALIDAAAPPISATDLFNPLLSQSSLSGKKAWALCDDCQKWRCVPDELVHVIEKSRWTCKDNIEEAFADCSVPQEKTDDEINNDLGISDKDYFSAAPMKLPAVQTTWARIKSNLFLHRNRRTLTIDEIMVCHCKPSPDGSLSCGEECLNRMLNIECVKGTCPCGNLCSNQQFQKRKYSKLKWIKCGKKGYGLQLEENASRGQFLIEYVGEVLDLAAYEARLRHYACRGQRHFYFMTLNGGEVIDACTKGNLGRYINHSCDPNCRTEKWMVNGEVCIGLFALRDIKKGEEITFDYNYVRVFGAAAKKCVCSSVDCRGYIGGDPSSSEVIVQDDSDAEDFEPVMIDEDCDTELSVAGVDSVATDAKMANHKKLFKERSETEENSTISEQGDNAQNQDLENHDTILSLQSQVDLIESENKIETDQTICENGSSTLSNDFESSLCGRPLESSGRSLATILRSEIQPTIDRAKISSQNSHKINLSIHPSEQVLTVSKSNIVVKAQLVKIKRSRVSIRSVISGKPKKVQSAISSRHAEGVEEKLNELLDEDGGIRRQKDAAKGYLKLLLVTAAAGDETRGSLSQSARDLSLILDAILKTKSRMVLVDIINKNGLQMLHNMMKQDRVNFNRIPILRKLLKVLEFLAEKEILSMDHINASPPCDGMESFKESMLKLIRHKDSQVHFIARNFADHWIPRPIWRVEPFEKDGRQLCPRNSLSWCLPSQFNSWHDRGNWDSSPLVSAASIPIQNMSSSSALFTDNGSIECTRQRKRKSRWDQPADDHNLSTMTLIKPSQVEPISEENISCLQQANENINDDEDDELPPGFESSCIEAYPQPPSSGPAAFKEAVIARPLERYMSHLTVSYGMPVDLIQQFGIPEIGLGDQLNLSWKIAPAVPFKPFPPLPSYPRQDCYASGAWNSIYNGNMSSNEKRFHLQQRNNNQWQQNG